MPQGCVQYRLLCSLMPLLAVGRRGAAAAARAAAGAAITPPRRRLAAADPPCARAQRRQRHVPGGAAKLHDNAASAAHRAAARRAERHGRAAGVQRRWGRALVRLPGPPVQGATGAPQGLAVAGPDWLGLQQRRAAAWHRHTSCHDCTSHVWMCGAAQQQGASVEMGHCNFIPPAELMRACTRRNCTATFVVHAPINVQQTGPGLTRPACDGAG